MSDYQDPPLRLAVAGLRWLGDQWQTVGDEPAQLDLHGTDNDDDQATILRALRRIAAGRLDMNLLALAAGREALDFDAPNAPTEDDMRGLVQHAESVLGALRALVQLAPELIPEDDDDV